MRRGRKFRQTDELRKKFRQIDERRRSREATPATCPKLAKENFVKSTYAVDVGWSPNSTLHSVNSQNFVKPTNAEKSRQIRRLSIQRNTFHRFSPMEDQAQVPIAAERSNVIFTTIFSSNRRIYNSKVRSTNAGINPLYLNHHYKPDVYATGVGNGKKYDDHL